MKSVSQSHGIIRFGVFELDLATRELQKSGVKVKLQDQPFQVLAMLLERPGDLVTREDLQKRLWPVDTFVDFDQGLGTAIRKLREALGDSADNPRFVETLPRRGYRFISPVSGNGRAAEVLPQQSEAPQAAQRRVLRRAVVVTAVVLALPALAYLFRPALPPPRVIGSTRITKDGLYKEGMVTDGSRIYFNAINGDRYLIFQVSASGGDSVPFLASIPEPAFPQPVFSGISPDRSQFLITTVGGNAGSFPLWILPVLGGSPRRLGNVRVTDGSAWSPDGKDVVYSQNDTLYRAKIDGYESQKIVSASGGVIESPRWSPDGRRLRFTVITETGGSSLWEAGADGKRLHPLLPGWNNPPSECCGTWTSDGKYFVFQSDRAGSSNVWAIRERGSFLRKVSHEPVQLTAGPTPTFCPLPSTDGHKLFVVTSHVRGELVRYDASTRQFVPYLSGISAIGVEFSSDSKWVVYVTYPEGTLWRSKVDGSERLQLTFPPLYVPESGCWSPNGSRIAFVGQQPGKPLNVYVISAEGGAPEQETSDDQAVWRTGWSADGNSLLISHFTNDDRRGKRGTVFGILNLRTHAFSRIPGSEGLVSPQWSPNRRQICALSTSLDRLVLFDIGTQKRTELVKTDSGAGNIAWSSAGDYIYFLGTPVAFNVEGIYRVRLRDGKLEEVVNLKNFRQANGSGAWTGLAPDDSPLLVRDVGEQDIYALDWQAP